MKKFLEKLKTPHPIFLALFYIVFVATVTGTLLLLVFVPQQGIWHYILYTLSATELAYFVYTVIYLAPKIKAKIINLLQRNRFTKNILENYGFRTLVFATIGFIGNVLYAVLQIVLGIIALSYWYVAIAIFYIAFIVIKIVVLFFGRKCYGDIVKENKIYLACGCMLNILPFALTGIIVLLFKSDMTFKYAGVMIYAVAAYTFFKIISSAVQIFKAKRQDSPIVQAVRNINLVSAMYSVLVLQVALIQAFGTNPKHFANGITGGVVAAMIFAISIIMIVKYRKIMAKVNSQKTENKISEGENK